MDKVKDDLLEIPPAFKREAPAKRKAAISKRRSKPNWIMPKMQAKKPKRSKGTNGMPSKDTKQALLIDMLKRPTGATIKQIMEKTGWQPHTVRGAIAGTIKKKLGHTIISEKSKGGVRTYRIPV